MTKMICFCFNYSEDNIINDVIAGNGDSSIMKRIITEKKAGNCRCKENNPKGK